MKVPPRGCHHVYCGRRDSQIRRQTKAEAEVDFDRSELELSSKLGSAAAAKAPLQACNLRQCGAVVHLLMQLQNDVFMRLSSLQHQGLIAAVDPLQLHAQPLDLCITPLQSCLHKQARRYPEAVQDAHRHQPCSVAWCCSAACSSNMLKIEVCLQLLCCARPFAAVVGDVETEASSRNCDIDLGHVEQCTSADLQWNLQVRQHLTWQLLSCS